MRDKVQAMYFQFTKYCVVCMFSNNLLKKDTHIVIAKQASQTLMLVASGSLAAPRIFAAPREDR